MILDAGRSTEQTRDDFKDVRGLSLGTLATKIQEEI